MGNGRSRRYQSDEHRNDGGVIRFEMEMDAAFKHEPTEQSDRGLKTSGRGDDSDDQLGR